MIFMQNISLIFALLFISVVGGARVGIVPIKIWRVLRVLLLQRDCGSNWKIYLDWQEC